MWRRERDPAGFREFAVAGHCACFSAHARAADQPAEGARLRRFASCWWVSWGTGEHAIMGAARAHVAPATGAVGQHAAALWRTQGHLGLDKVLVRMRRADMGSQGPAGRARLP